MLNNVFIDTEQSQLHEWNAGGEIQLNREPKSSVKNIWLTCETKCSLRACRISQTAFPTWSGMAWRASPFGESELRNDLAEKTEFAIRLIVHSLSIVPSIESTSIYLRWWEFAALHAYVSVMMLYDSAELWRRVSLDRGSEKVTLEVPVGWGTFAFDKDVILQWWCRGVAE